jgi:hypothetical protein
MTSTFKRGTTGILLAVAAAGSLAAPALADEIPAWLTERRIIGTDDLEPIEAVKTTSAYRFARIVARVETTDGQGFCTASRLSRDLFLTNFHCYEFTPCAGLRFHMGYERDLPDTEQAVFRCKDVLSKNRSLDYALYRAEQVRGGDGVERGEAAEFPTATLFGGQLSVSRGVIVASHPAARPKEIDRSSACKLTTATVETVSGRETIRHTCDTEGGSSGSPVLDRLTGQIVALHWGGADENNFAIPMSKIVARLKAELGPSDFAKLRIAP